MGPERNGTFSARMGRALSAALLPAYYYPGAPLRAIGGFALLTRSFRMRTVHLRLTRYAVQGLRQAADVASVVGLHALRGGRQLAGGMPGTASLSRPHWFLLRVCVRRDYVPGALSRGSCELVRLTQPGRWPRQHGGGTTIWMIGATARRWTRCRNCTSRARGEAGLGAMGGEGKQG